MSEASSRTQEVEKEIEEEQKEIKDDKEEGVNKYKNMDLIELRKKREEQVNLLAFEEVAIIDEAIQNYHQDNTEKIIEEETKKLSTIIDELFERYGSAINEVNKEAEEKTNKTRGKSEETLKQMKERHEQKKKELEDKKTHRIQRAEERRSVKDKELKEKAKNLARQGEITEAIQYRTESEQMKEQEINARKNEINNRFEIMMNTIRTQEENNTKIIEDNFNSAFDKIQVRKEEAITAQSQVLRGNLTNALQKAIYSGTRSVKREKRVDFIQRINGFVQNKIETEKQV